jgi:cell wall-associated NlpC family hydrolase
MPDATAVKVPPAGKQQASLARTPRAASASTFTPTNVKSALQATRLTAVTAVAPTLESATPRLSAAPRFGAARLPARGGLILKPTPIEIRPQRTPTVSESQRLLLARLDADLARAQKRLNRAEIRLSDGQKQLGSATSLLRSAMMEAGDEGRGLNPFVRVAQRYLGTPYVWGGESARGFDCSGFIMRVMRDLGYQALPHSAAEQFRYGMPVAKELLKAGDIVFFANTYKPGVSHVGIYLGRGRFIHAANSQDGTIVSSLNEPKWVEKYAGARRLVSTRS